MEIFKGLRAQQPNIAVVFKVWVTVRHFCNYLIMFWVEINWLQLKAFISQSHHNFHCHDLFGLPKHQDHSFFETILLLWQQTAIRSLDIPLVLKLLTVNSSWTASCYPEQFKTRHIASWREPISFHTGSNINT